MADPAQLKNQLEAYQEILSSHLARMREEYDTLKDRWASLSDVWEGSAAEEVRHFWTGAAADLEAHLEEGEALATYLAERLEHLQRFAL